MIVKLSKFISNVIAETLAEVICTFLYKTKIFSISFSLKLINYLYYIFHLVMSPECRTYLLIKHFYCIVSLHLLTLHTTYKFAARQLLLVK